MITFEVLFTPSVRSCLGCGLKVSLGSDDGGVASAMISGYEVCYNCGSRFREPRRYPAVL
jgi:hypothetical protein